MYSVIDKSQQSDDINMNVSQCTKMILCVKTETWFQLFYYSTILSLMIPRTHAEGHISGDLPDQRNRRIENFNF